jgi:hypothetical protein
MKVYERNIHSYGRKTGKTSNEWKDLQLDRAKAMSLIRDTTEYSYTVKVINPTSFFPRDGFQPRRVFKNCGEDIQEGKG